MPRRSPAQLGVAIAVIAGLVTSTALVVFGITDPQGALPGVALGSELILDVERVLTLFAAWMLVIVVIVRAAAGELPAEISGRGLKYADAENAQRALSTSRQALDQLRAEVDEMREIVFGQAEDR